jgi:predicted transcriptional regulator
MQEIDPQAEFEKRLEELAKATGRTRSQLIREAVLGFLSHEDGSESTGPLTSPPRDGKNPR